MSEALRVKSRLPLASFLFSKFTNRTNRTRKGFFFDSGRAGCLPAGGENNEKGRREIKDAGSSTKRVCLRRIYYLSIIFFPTEGNSGLRAVYARRSRIACRVASLHAFILPFAIHTSRRLFGHGRSARESIARRVPGEITFSWFFLLLFKRKASSRTGAQFPFLTCPLNKGGRGSAPNALSER